MSQELLSTALGAAGTPELEEIVRTFPDMLERLRSSYDELERRAAHVEGELVRANEALEDKVIELDTLKRHLEAVLDSIPTGVVERDAHDRIVRVNDSALSILGLGEEDLLGKSGSPMLPGRKADGKAHEVTRLDGERLVIRSVWSPIGRGAGSVEIIEDLTTYTALTERLHAADKFASLGTMAGGIAHEIRNPLNAVKGFAHLLEREPIADERIRRWCSMIVQGAHEADTIIENMLSFGSPERLRKEPIDGFELLESAVKATLVDEQNSQVSIESTVPPFIGDMIKLRQAVRNLVTNALDAQDHRGTVTVTLNLVGDFLEFRVEDAGPGVPEEIRHKLTDPFFTTRPEGTGLGMALVASIARLHGGGLEISPKRSALGGATILIRIPFEAASLPATHPTEPERS